MKDRTFKNFAFAPLYIGYHGENLVTGVDIDLANVLPYGWGAGLLLRRAGESSEYEATSTLEGSVLRVTFETFDCLKEGRGEATVELRGPNGEKRKSNTAQTIVEHALDLSGDPPEPPEQYRTAAQQDIIDAGKLSKAAQAEKTVEMTQPVGVDDSGRLWVPPGGGGGNPRWGDVLNKPFERLGTTMRVQDGTLDVYISETANPAGGNTLSIG